MKAFPRPASEAHQHGMHNEQEGMDLRDYFAAKAMEGLIIKSINDGGLTWERIAKNAYVIANEMMQAREIK